MVGQGIDFCSTYKPIIASSTDSSETLRQILVQNLLYKQNC